MPFSTPPGRYLPLCAFLFAALFSGVATLSRIAGVHAARRTAETGEWPAAAEAPPRPGVIPVLVELFTSEGCSSCPTADAVLARLQLQQPVSGAEIIVLEEHVDYWDSLGWRDRFSSHQFTDRQNAYAQRLRLETDYTPQMIVDGTDQFVGNDMTRALRAVAQAAQMPKLSLSVSPPVLDAGRISGTVSSAATLPKGEVYAALVDAMASTDVLQGENGGRSLHHVSVVRGMQRLGSLAALSHGPLNFSFNLPADSTGPGTRIIVFAQRPNQGAIVAATTLSTVTSPSRQLASR